jgi:hypothetical protein
MTMPPQLARAKRRRSRHSEPRPIVERLPRIDIADLCRWQVFPDQCDWHKDHLLELPFRYPFLKNLVISLQTIDANHVSGYIQNIRLRWIRTGFGGNFRPRPLFVCECGRPVTKLYFKYGSLHCRRCTNAVYASQVCSGRKTRSHLQATRLQNFIRALPPKVRRTTKARLAARQQALAKQAQDTVRKSTRIDHKAKHIQSNYDIRTTAYWR